MSCRNSSVSALGELDPVHAHFRGALEERVVDVGDVLDVDDLVTRCARLG